MTMGKFYSSLSEVLIWPKLGGKGWVGNFWFNIYSETWKIIIILIKNTITNQTPCIWKAALWRVNTANMVSFQLSFRRRTQRPRPCSHSDMLCVYCPKPVGTFIKKFWKQKYFTFYLNAIEDYIQISAMFTWRYPKPHFTLTTGITNLNFKKSQRITQETAPLPFWGQTQALAHKDIAAGIPASPTF